MRTARSLTVLSQHAPLRGGGGASSRGWGVVSHHALRQTPPGTEFLTNASENITLPQTSFAGGKNEEVKKLLQIKSCDSAYGRHGGMGRDTNQPVAPVR